MCRSRTRSLSAGVVGQGGGWRRRDLGRNSRPRRRLGSGRGSMRGCRRARTRPSSHHRPAGPAWNGVGGRRAACSNSSRTVALKLTLSTGSSACASGPTGRCTDPIARHRRRHHGHRRTAARGVRPALRLRPRLDVRIDGGVFAAAALPLAAFVLIEAQDVSPLVPSIVFKNRSAVVAGDAERAVEPEREDQGCGDQLRARR